MKPTEEKSAPKAHATRSSESGRQGFILDLWGVRYQVEDVSGRVGFWIR